MKYCRDAEKLLGKRVECGKDCPILKTCPRLILEAAVDIATRKAIDAMIRSYERDRTV
mgnify:CR=1 FL=1